MTRIVLSQQAVEQLTSVGHGAEVCDKSGRVVGFFTPTRDPTNYVVVNPPTEEELDEIERNLDGRPLHEIMKDLEKKK